MKRNQFEIEICANSVISAIAAEKGGADRVELCDNLYEGGTTPSPGMIFQTKLVTSLNVFPIIRPRGGDFLYSKDEMDVMLKDIEVAYNIGADGIVIGCLRANGKIDYEKCSRLIEAAKGLPITFHRAFDMTIDAFEALDTCMKLGLSRVLTSGQKNKAIDGVSLIAELVRHAGNNVIIMPGSGISEDNIQYLAGQTKAKAFHLSLRNSYESGMEFRRNDIYMGGTKEIPEFAHKYTSAERVSALIAQIENM
jgi:copper homeostasis protein